MQDSTSCSSPRAPRAPRRLLKKYSGSRAGVLRGSDKARMTIAMRKHRKGVLTLYQSATPLRPTGYGTVALVTGSAVILQQPSRQASVRLDREIHLLLPRQKASL